MSAPTEPQDGRPAYDYLTLRKVGAACYGGGLTAGGRHFWVGAMAVDLKVNTRVIERWASGDYDIPPNIWRELVDICRERAVDLKTLANALEKGASIG